MKKIIALSGIAMCFVVVATAQTYSPENNPTVTAITSKYTLVETNHQALADEQVFPALGSYQPAENSGVTGTIHITQDATNKGIVWIEGLPQGKIKAMLRMSPTTYKIPAQKTEDGKDVAEGVLLYDQDAKKLSVCIGCLFDQNNPQSAFQQNSELNNVIVNSVVTADDQNKKANKSKTKKDKTTAKKETKPQPWIITATKEGADGAK